MELSGCQSSKMTRQFKFVWNRKFQSYREIESTHEFEFYELLEGGRNTIFFLCKLIFQKHNSSIFKTNSSYYQFIKFKEVIKNVCYRNN